MENDNPKGISELERIKWLIARIDLYHKINLQGIESGKQIIETTGEKSLTEIKSRKKTAFSILGVILTIILSINSIYSIPEWAFYLSLSILAGISLIIYIIYNWMEKLIENVFNFISNLAIDARVVISESQSFVASNFADLGFIELKQVKNYGVFVMLLGIANLVNMNNQFKKFRNKKTSWFVDLFKDEFKEIEKTKEQVPDLLKRYDKTDTYPKKGFDLIEKIFTKDILEEIQEHKK